MREQKFFRSLLVTTLACISFVTSVGSDKPPVGDRASGAPDFLENHSSEHRPVFKHRGTAVRGEGRDGENTDGQVSTRRENDDAGPKQQLVLPNPILCLHRPKHSYANGNFYYYSWIDVMSKNLELNWLDARNWCRQRCMETVSLETAAESFHMNSVIQRTGVPYVWTSGRKCDFDGCERPDLQPSLINGWFWSGSGVRLPPTTSKETATFWSSTGGSGKRQPDNREFEESKTEESCLAILNNFYNDGVKWHDVACHHRKPWICEDSQELLAYARRTAPNLRII